MHPSAPHDTAGSDIKTADVLWINPDQFPLSYRPRGYPFQVRRAWRAGTTTVVNGDVLSGAGDPLGTTTLLVPSDQPRAVRDPNDGAWYAPGTETSAPFVNDLTDPHHDGGFVVNRRPTHGSA